MARACLYCQRGKVHRLVHLLPAEIPVLHHRFAHIHVDLVRLLPPLHGHTYLFTIFDRTSRWTEAIPLSSITAADCARALFASWVSQFGVPDTITSDRGAQYTRPTYGRACAVCSTSSIRPRHHTILNQTTMTESTPLPMWHNSAPAPSSLPELLLACFVLVRQDGTQPPLSQIYDGLYGVLERSTHFILLEIGDRTDKCPHFASRRPGHQQIRSQPSRHAGVAPLRRRHPVRTPPPPQWGRLRQVTLNLPPTTPQKHHHHHQHPAARFATPGRLLCNARPPNRLNL
jgi:hypothetical protein